MSDFFQEAPEISNTFKSDPLLSSYLKSKLQAVDQTKIFAHLERCGELASTQWLQWAQQAEQIPPRHVPYDAWGRKIDDIQLSEGWKNIEMAAAQEGIVAIAYERKYKEFSRVYQLALLYLFHPSSAFVSCPLAMTDGAARALELMGQTEKQKHAFKHLTSRDPAQFWTSGQWMTERTGGSDVSGTSTIAKNVKGQWLLSGTKWFTSATTSQMTMTLARPEKAEPGSRGLSLFFVELRDQLGQLQNIQIHRLKDKLGTRALPTAELSLMDTPAELVGGEGHGVKKIAAILNITRIYNSICALGHMRRLLDLAKNYSDRRVAFGKKLSEHPLHQNTLLHLETTFAQCFRMTFLVGELLGKEEVGIATESEKTLLRCLTPIVKLYTGKKVMEIASEVVEIFGGAGYVEDTGIPRGLRDAQVFSIWEGTTNVLSLDFLRALEKDHSGPILLEYFNNKYGSKLPGPLQQAIQMLGFSRDEVEPKARQLAFTIAEHL